MSDIKIKPIFDQSAPGIWHDFAHIHAVTRFADYDADALTDEENKLVHTMVTNWKKKRGCKYAFAAYDDHNMVGFILGYAAARSACVEYLFVLPQYHGCKIGKQLLSNAESALSMVASSVELISLANAMSFYESRGYKSCVCENLYIKFLNNNIRSKFIPVFQVSASLNRRCLGLNPGFDKNMVNRDHQPMFVHFDDKSCVDGYVGAGTNMPCMRSDKNSSYVKNILQSMFNSYTR